VGLQSHFFLAMIQVYHGLSSAQRAEGNILLVTTVTLRAGAGVVCCDHEQTNTSRMAGWAATVMSVRSFMEEYRYGTEPTNDGRRKRAGVIFTLAQHRTWITLCRIEAVNAGNGDGSKGLDWLCQLADNHGVRLSGIADPFGSRFLSLDALLDWYTRHGFEVLVTDCYYIDREPK